MEFEHGGEDTVVRACLEEDEDQVGEKQEDGDGMRQSEHVSLKRSPDLNIFARVFLGDDGGSVDGRNRKGQAAGQTSEPRTPGGQYDGCRFVWLALRCEEKPAPCLGDGLVEDGIVASEAGGDETQAEAQQHGGQDGAEDCMLNDNVCMLRQEDDEEDNLNKGGYPVVGAG